MSASLQALVVKSHVANTTDKSTFSACASQVVQVAVIDEVQMLGDRTRGWAWTRALLGLAAHEVGPLRLCQG